MNVQIDVQVASKDESVPNADDISLWVSRTVAASGRGSVGDVSIRVVDEKEMQGLNNRFRDQDNPTNVLSFPAGEIDGLPTGAELPLGDIVVCAAIVTLGAYDCARNAAFTGFRPPKRRRCRGDGRPGNTNPY